MCEDDWLHGASSLFPLLDLWSNLSLAQEYHANTTPLSAHNLMSAATLTGASEFAIFCGSCPKVDMKPMYGHVVSLTPGGFPALPLLSLP